MVANGIKAIQTGQQCKSKVKNLTDEYKKITDANSKSGNNTHQFVYYDAVDEVLGSRDGVKPMNISEVGTLLKRPQAMPIIRHLRILAIVLQKRRQAEKGEQKEERRTMGVN